MFYYNLYALPHKKDFLCRVEISGYEEAVKVGKRVAEECGNVYIKSIPVEQCKIMKYRKGSYYYDY